MKCFRLLLEDLVWIDHQFLSGIRDSRKPKSLWGMMRDVRGGRKSIQQSWLAKGLGFGLQCWGFKGDQEEIPREEASTLQIGSVAFLPGQYTSPQLRPCHRLFDQDGHQDFLSFLIFQTLFPVTFGYSLNSDAVIMRQLRRWKTLWRRWWTRSHKMTSIGSSRSCWNVTTMHCSRRRLHRRGLEFHMSNTNKSAHQEKVWKLMVCISYIYIYIYIYKIKMQIKLWEQKNLKIK